MLLLCLENCPGGIRAVLKSGIITRMVRSVRAGAIACLLLAALSAGFIEAKYKAKPLPLRPAAQFSAHQDFQKIVMGAFPAAAKEDVKKLFDTDKLHEKRILPVLLVIENNNEFPIQIDGSEIFLIEPDGSKQSPVSFLDVLLKIGKEKPRSNYSDKRDLVQKAVKKEIFADFEEKAFLRKQIDPGKSDHGVLFFMVPYDGLKGTSLYLPEVINVRDQEALIFFEFELFPRSD